MIEFWIAMICVVSIIALGFGTWGIASFVYWCIDKRDRKKWDITVAKYPEVLDYQKEANMLLKAYEEKSEEANRYKKQIDGLIGNLCYLPSYEVEWRKEKAEEYKTMYFETNKEADKMCELYHKAHNKVIDYCEEHKLHRWY